MDPMRPAQPDHSPQSACPAAPVRPKRRSHARTAATVALFASAAFIGVLAPQTAAAQPALPLPLPVTAVEPLVTEGVSIEGPLVNNLTLPTLR